MRHDKLHHKTDLNVKGWDVNPLNGSTSSDFYNEDN